MRLTPSVSHGATSLVGRSSLLSTLSFSPPNSNSYVHLLFESSHMILPLFITGLDASSPSFMAGMDASTPLFIIGTLASSPLFLVSLKVAIYEISTIFPLMTTRSRSNSSFLDPTATSTFNRALLPAETEELKSRLLISVVYIIIIGISWIRSPCRIWSDSAIRSELRSLVSQLAFRIIAVSCSEAELWYHWYISCQKRRQNSPIFNSYHHLDLQLKRSQGEHAIWGWKLGILFGIMANFERALALLQGSSRRNNSQNSSLKRKRKSLAPFILTLQNGFSSDGSLHELTCKPDPHFKPS